MMTDVGSLVAATEAARKKEEDLMALRARREAVEWRANASLFEEHGPRTEAAERKIVREVAEAAAARRMARMQAAMASPVTELAPQRLEQPVSVCAPAHCRLLPPMRLLEQLWTGRAALMAR
jgi:hypothetical protein